MNWLSQAISKKSFWSFAGSLIIIFFLGCGYTGILLRVSGAITADPWISLPLALALSALFIVSIPIVAWLHPNKTSLEKETKKLWLFAWKISPPAFILWVVRAVWRITQKGLK